MCHGKYIYRKIKVSTKHYNIIGMY